jgi:hypothetical protein
MGNHEAKEFAYEVKLVQVEADHDPGQRRGPRSRGLVPGRRPRRWPQASPEGHLAFGANPIQRNPIDHNPHCFAVGRGPLTTDHAIGLTNARLVDTDSRLPHRSIPHCNGK